MTSNIPKKPSVGAPTPQNTPANAAPINSRAQAPGLGSVPEDDADRIAAASILAKNPALVGMIQNKLSGLVGQSSGYVENLPLHVRRRLAGLKAVQKDHSKLEAQFQEEVLELEKKYHAKYTPLYQKRADIVGGKTEPSEEEVQKGIEVEDEDDEPFISLDKKEDEDDTPMTGIPEFWLTAMKNSPSLQDMITEEDEAALKHLSDIRMEYLEKPGFKLVFTFASNEYFSNTDLSKTYFYQEENGYGGDFIYDHADGDTIKWNANKDLTVKVEQKKQRNKNTKQTRIVKKTVPKDSFFNFFSPPKPPKDDDENEEVAEDLEDRLELDYQIGEEIKEKLIPRAIDWFTGEALAMEGISAEDLEEGEFEDEDDLDDDDDSDEKDDDEESDEEEGDGPRSAKQDAAECKQS